MKRVVIGGLAVGITALAAGSAWVSNIALGYWIAVPTEALPAAPAGETSKEPMSVADRGTTERIRSKRQLVDGILARNIFDHTAIGATQAPETVSEGGEQVTDLKLRLLATMVAEPAVYSSALIARDDRDGSSRGYGIGDSIVDGAVIVEIEKKRVVLERNGKREVLMFDDKEAPKRSGGSSKPATMDDETGVSSEGDNKFTIPFG